jgi:threonine synthase
MSSQPEMRYFSTRGGDETLSFEEVSEILMFGRVVHWLMPAPGCPHRSRSKRRVSAFSPRKDVRSPSDALAYLYSLYIPTHIPSLPSDWQTRWATLSFPELSHEILSLFIPTDIIPTTDLKQIIDASYSTFRSPLVTPLRQTGADEYVMELWHGPTWAFKDVALQFLGNLFAYFLGRRNAAGADEELTVVGATSGDTGRWVFHLRGTTAPLQISICEGMMQELTSATH